MRGDGEVREECEDVQAGGPRLGVGHRGWGRGLWIRGRSQGLGEEICEAGEEVRFSGLLGCCVGGDDWTDGGREGGGGEKGEDGEHGGGRLFFEEGEEDEVEGDGGPELGEGDGGGGRNTGGGEVVEELETGGDIDFVDDGAVGGGEEEGGFGFVAVAGFVDGDGDELDRVDD